MDIDSELKRAIDLAKRREFKKAENIYKSILKIEPNNNNVLSCLGLMYYTLGSYKKAEKVLSKVFNIKPVPSLCECLAFVKYALKKPKDAVYYSRLIENDKKTPALMDITISALIDIDSYTEAYELSVFFNNKFPFLKESLFYLAFSSICVGKLDDASKFANQMIKFFPEYSNSWYIAGIVNEVIYHNDVLAFKCFKKQIKYGDLSDGYLNLIVSSLKQKKYKSAEYYLRQLKKISPKNSEYNFIRAILNFYQRKFKLGFKYYSRKKNPLVDSNPNLKLSKKWDGKPDKNATLLLYCDQGAGDCIMFCRYIPQIKDKFKKIIIAVRPDLIDLLKRSNVSSNSYKYIELLDAFHTKYDKSVVMSNLPYYLKSDIDDIPYSDGYLNADKEKTENYKNKYFQTDKLKVGLCWEAGGYAWREQLNRTVPVSVFDNILFMKNVQYYSLQLKPIEDSYLEYGIVDLGSTFKNFDYTAAAIKNLDVVITVDTSVAHLSAALGVRTYMLLPYVTDWRWFNDTRTTPWYDSMTIFKQTDKMLWDNEILSIKKHLEDMLK